MHIYPPLADGRGASLGMNGAPSAGADRSLRPTRDQLFKNCRTFAKPVLS